MTRTTLAALTDELEDLRERRAAEIRKRIDDLIDLRKRIDDELLVLADEADHVDTPNPNRRRSRHILPECGTESGYQRHRRLKEACEPCKIAHANHERIKAAQRRLNKMTGGAA